MKLATMLAQAEPSPAKETSAPTLKLNPSSTPISGGKVSLDIGELIRQGTNYVGTYHIKVSPYFFKNEKGQLSIVAPDDSMQKLTNGIAVDFTGQAVSDSTGKKRRIDGKVMPSGKDNGKVTLWFMASDRKLTFNTSYLFGKK